MIYFTAAFVPPNSMKLFKAPRPASCATAFESVTIFFQREGSLSHGLKHCALSSGEIENSFESSSYACNRTFHIYLPVNRASNNIDVYFMCCSFCYGEGRIVFFVSHARVDVFFKGEVERRVEIG